MLASRKQSASIVTMLLTFILSSVVLKMVIGDIPLGDQHCGDPKCLEPISVGRTVLKYRANSNLMLSFNPSTPVKIFSKDMNDGGEIWGVEIEGKRGFVNRRHIQETRIFKSQLGHRVTEGNGSNSERNEPVNYVVDKISDRPEPENIEKDISIEPPKQNHHSDNSEEIFNPVKETVAEETKDTEGLDTTKEPVDTDQSTSNNDININEIKSMQSNLEYSLDMDKDSNSTDTINLLVWDETEVVKAKSHLSTQSMIRNPQNQTKYSNNYIPLKWIFMKFHGEDFEKRFPKCKNSLKRMQIKRTAIGKYNYTENIVNQKSEKSSLETDTMLHNASGSNWPINELNFEMLYKQFRRFSRKVATKCGIHEKLYGKLEKSNKTEYVMTNIPNKSFGYESEYEKSDLTYLGFILHILESFRDISPEWLHKTIHGETIDSVPMNAIAFSWILIVSLLALHLVTLIFDKISREKPLMSKISKLDRMLFNTRNELIFVQRELDETRSTIPFEKTLTSKAKDIANSTSVESIKMESPKRSHIHQSFTHLHKEIQSLKTQIENLEKDNHHYNIRNQDLTKELELQFQQINELKLELQRKTNDLKEKETIAKELTDEKDKKHANSTHIEELVKAMDLHRIQLEMQRDSVKLYEEKISKREAEFDEKVQELIMSKSELAEARLAINTIELEKNDLLKTIKVQKAQEEILLQKIKLLENEALDFEEIRLKYQKFQNDLDGKESELETKSREISILKETINTLTNNNNNSNDTLDTSEYKAGSPESGDKRSIILSDKQSRILKAVHETAQLKVDLSNATEKCKSLRDELAATLNEKNDISMQLTKIKGELNVARLAKDDAVKVKNEVEHKHQALIEYYSQREADFQKQIGILTSNLGNANENSNASERKIGCIFDELESIKAQNKMYKTEIEEQETSFRSQIATFEKRLHENRISIQQERRKNTDAKNEMQTLRNRLTVAETKLLEREVEIKNYEDENKTLKDAMENLVEKASISSNKSTNQQLINDGTNTSSRPLGNANSTLIKSELDMSNYNSVLGSDFETLSVNEAPPELPPLTLQSFQHGIHREYQPIVSNRFHQIDSMFPVHHEDVYSFHPSIEKSHLRRRSNVAIEERTKARSFVENGEAFEDEHHGYASGSSSYRDRNNHHSKRRENVAGEDSLRERIQGKHGPKTSSPMV